jgi:trans-2-enoyl-CoA reductase
MLALAIADEIHTMKKVMGSEDWQPWIQSFHSEKSSITDVKNIASSYSGPEISGPI